MKKEKEFDYDRMSIIEAFAFGMVAMCFIFQLLGKI